MRYLIVGAAALALLAAGALYESRGAGETDVPAIELRPVEEDARRPKAGRERTESDSAMGGADQPPRVSGGAEPAPAQAPAPAGGGADDDDADERDDDRRDDDSGDDDDDGGGDD